MSPAWLALPSCWLITPRCSFPGKTKAPLSSLHRATLSSLLPSAPICPTPCSWSVAVNAASITQTAATVRMSAPSVGGPFDKFVLAVCRKPASGAVNWAVCPQSTCLAAQAAACPITGLSANSSFAVSAVAYSGTTPTIRSSADNFATLVWP